MMWERWVYYLELLAALCGFDGADGPAAFGWLVVAIAAAIVVYTFYIGITRMLWPGEQMASHIKNRILEDGDREDIPRAH